MHVCMHVQHSLVIGLETRHFWSMVVWHCDNSVGHMNKVTLSRDWLVLRWVITCDYTVSVCNHHPGQLSLLPSAGREMSGKPQYGDALWLAVV